MEDVPTRDGRLPFSSLHVRVREHIVADGLPDVDAVQGETGRLALPGEFHELVARGDGVVVDCRNFYESEVGRFEGAHRLDVDAYRDTWGALDEVLAPQYERAARGEPPANVLIYCTGGIRCVKVGAYLTQKMGLPRESVISLAGGINAYADWAHEVKAEPLFKGKNFAFDSRLSGPDQRVSADVLAKCHSCGTPCDHHTNCTNELCHVLTVMCDACRAKHHGGCSPTCGHVVTLPPDVKRQFHARVHASPEFQSWKTHTWKAARASDGTSFRRKTTEDVETQFGALFRRLLDELPQPPPRDAPQ